MSYFSKLLTMMGRGRDIVSAPLTAVMLPTSFPSPEIGKISPYLGNKDETAVWRNQGLFLLGDYMTTDYTGT